MSIHSSDEVSGEINKYDVFAITKRNVSTFRKVALIQGNNIFQITNALCYKVMHEKKRCIQDVRQANRF